MKPRKRHPSAARFRARVLDHLTARIRALDVLASKNAETEAHRNAARSIRDEIQAWR